MISETMLSIYIIIYFSLWFIDAYGFFNELNMC